jgi:hypothetical protein
MDSAVELDMLRSPTLNLQERPLRFCSTIHVVRTQKMSQIISNPSEVKEPGKKLAV